MLYDRRDDVLRFVERKKKCAHTVSFDVLQQLIWLLFLNSRLNIRQIRSFFQQNNPAWHYTTEQNCRNIKRPLDGLSIHRHKICLNRNGLRPIIKKFSHTNLWRNCYLNKIVFTSILHALWLLFHWDKITGLLYYIGKRRRKKIINP